MAEIKFSSYSPGWQRAYWGIQLVSCAACLVILILSLILWDVKYLPVLFIAAGISNAAETADRFRKKRGKKRNIGQSAAFFALAVVCFAFAAVSVFMLWVE